MAKNSPILYSVQKTFIWFAVVSVILTASLAAIVLLDHHREWKEWQKKFVKLKMEKTREDLKRSGQTLDKKKLEDLKKQQADARAAAASQRTERDKLKAETDKLDPALLKTKAEYQSLKQFHDSYNYYFEEYSEKKDPRASEFDAKIRALAPKLQEAKLRLEAAEKAKEEAEARLAAVNAKEKAIQGDIDKVLEEQNRLQMRLENIKPSIAKDILNAPMIDFIAPSLQIQQIVLEDLEDDYHFARVQKVDRCTTCHLGIDQKGFSAEGGSASGGEKIPQPFRAHPNLDLYLGPASPHPIEKFGCTVCHGGSGHSVSFKDSAHTPRNEEQAKEWSKKHHWEELEKWDAKMLSMDHIQAACAKCHTGVVEVPKADKLNRGRKLAETHGCFSCHKVRGFEDNWKVGPDLQHVQSKLSEDWVVKWLENPRDFRDSTSMPRIFHLSNTATPQDVERDIAAERSIAAYLMKNSEPVALSSPTLKGDGSRGEKLVKEVGCLGCHSLPGTHAGHFAPELSGLGSKVSKEWLYSWLKDPKHFSKQTRMPSLRLSDQEASDITAYLLSLRNENFEAKPAPKAKPEVVDGMILASLQGTMRRVEAETKLAEMNTDERMQFLGKKSIAHQGCYSCHSIKGFSAEGGSASGGEAKPIGTELSDEGRKNIHQFDFGFTGIERTRQAWVSQKLKEPRVFDHGKVKDYYEKLRMPQFHFTDDEVDALTTFVLSLTQEEIPLGMQRRLDLKETQTEKGRLLVSKLNCTGCHTLDGKTGTLRELVENEGLAPPMLDGEGAKVQEVWLHDFLRSPVTIRPWLTYRMPTFGFEDGDASTLVQYFDNLSGQEISYHGVQVPPASPENLATGKKLFDLFQCVKCHQITQDSAAMGASFLAPDLALTKKRLKPDWVTRWLNDPQALQAGTMMPSFFPEGQSPAPDILEGDAHKQIEAIRDYLYRFETAPDGEEGKKAVAK